MKKKIISLNTIHFLNSSRLTSQITEMNLKLVFPINRAEREVKKKECVGKRILANGGQISGILNF